MLLPRGMAQKVHVIQNLKWVMSQVGVAGMSGASSSVVWQNVKALAVMNVPIATTHALKGIEASKVEWGYAPGEYAPFTPVLEIVDMGGLAAPVLLKTGILQFSPAIPGVTLNQMASLLKARNHDSKTVKYGVVSYYHPSLFDRGWGVYPLHFGEGKVLCVFGEKGMEKDALHGMFARFALYRMVFPYTRIVWPRLASELVYCPVVVKNGQEKKKENQIRDEYDFGGEMEPMTFLEMQAMLPAPPKQFDVPVPLFNEIPVPAPVKANAVLVPVVPVMGAETPKAQAQPNYEEDDPFAGILTSELKEGEFAQQMADRKKGPETQEKAEPAKVEQPKLPPAKSPSPQQSKVEVVKVAQVKILPVQQQLPPQQQPKKPASTGPPGKGVKPNPFPVLEPPKGAGGPGGKTPK